MYLPVGSLIKFNGLTLSEHNRSPLVLGYNRIEKSQRMSNGSLRKFFIKDKKTISISWNMLPSYSNFTVDGGYGALDLKNFYDGSAEKANLALSGRNTFDVEIKYSTLTGTTTEILEMIFSSFSCELVKRNVKNSSADLYPQEFWTVSLSLEEV
jgi:hypothetical protein